MFFRLIVFHSENVVNEPPSPPDVDLLTDGADASPVMNLFIWSHPSYTTFHTCIVTTTLFVGSDLQCHVQFQLAALPMFLSFPKSVSDVFFCTSFVG